MPSLKIKKSSLQNLNGNKKSIVNSNSKILNNKVNLNQQYLDFDYDIDKQFLNTLPSLSDNKIDYSKIEKLPKFKSSNHVISIDDTADDDVEETEIENVSKKCIPEDIDELDKHMIGSILYYIDYNKGIIYNTDYNIIGMIDDNGDINIDSYDK